MERLVQMKAPLGATDSVHYGMRSYEIKEGYVMVPSDVAPELEKMNYVRVVPVGPAEPVWRRPYGFTGPTGATGPYWDDHNWNRPPGFTGPTGATASYRNPAFGATLATGSYRP
jgi:hypothetical protein